MEEQHINIRKVISTEIISEPSCFNHIYNLEGVKIPMKTAKIKRVVQVTTEYDEMYCSNCDTWEPPDSWHTYHLPVREFVFVHCGQSYLVNPQ